MTLALPAAPPALARRASHDRASHDRASHDRARLAVALGVAAAIHAGTALAVPRLFRSPSPPPHDVVVTLDVELTSPPPPPPPPPAPQQAPPPVAEPRGAEAKAPPPASVSRGEWRPAARASAVLTRAPDPREPLDFSTSFVTGAAETYAGGATSALGTSAAAVSERPASGPGPAASGAHAADSPAPKGPDRSRRPSVVGAAEWRCPFPGEADHQQIDHAVATLRVEVDTTGAVTGVTVTRDPGSGFGREARRCALDKRWAPALDRDGAAVAGSALVNVRFDR